MSKNTTQIKAAVVREKGGPFNIETLTLEAPRRDEVLIKVVATGFCHTDIVARDKGYPVPQPIVLGHEGAGIVESVGADVLKVAPGDSVVLMFLTCGRCKLCRLGKMAHCEKTFPLCFGGARLDGSTASLDAHGELFTRRQ
jgi:aryl-alcohol dehydrogenase